MGNWYESELGLSKVITVNMEGFFSAAPTVHQMGCPIGQLA